MLLVVHRERTFWEMEKKQPHNKPLFRRNEHITQILSGSDLGNPSAEKGCCTNFGISRVCGRDDKKTQNHPYSTFGNSDADRLLLPALTRSFRSYARKVISSSDEKRCCLPARTSGKESVYQGLSRPRTLLSSCGLPRTSNANHHKPLSTNINGPRQAL